MATLAQRIKARLEKPPAMLQTPGWSLPTCSAASGKATRDQRKEEAEEKGEQHPSALPTRYESRCSSCSTARKNTQPGSRWRAQPCPVLPPALPADAQQRPDPGCWGRHRHQDLGLIQALTVSGQPHTAKMHFRSFLLVPTDLCANILPTNTV